MADGSINIRPGVGILALFPNMNYRAWYALGELVDNAIDSYLTHKKALQKHDGEDFKLRIVIEVEPHDGGFIRVWDNAAGIGANNYGRAFVTAEPPTDSAGLSQFGIGMKSASCWFAREWRVRSTALGEEIERTVEFDVPAIIREQRESLNPSVAGASRGTHFTEVRLWNLYKPPHTQTVAKMRRHLASMYRQFLRNGDVAIEFNGSRLEYVEPRILVAPFYKEPTGGPRLWRKEVAFTLSTGESVSGFVALRETGSTKEAGLSLYRHHRLIVGSNEDSYRPPQIFGGSNSYSYQRVFGELSMDNFEVSHTKDGFIWEDRQDELLRLLRREMDADPIPVLQQAEGYRARKAPSNLSSAATKAIATTAAVLPHAQQMIESQIADTPEVMAPPMTYGGTPVNSSRTLLLNIKGDEWAVSIDTTTDPAATEWLKIRERGRTGKSRELGILISVSHAFTQRFGGATADDIEGLVRLGVGLAIAETTAREAGVSMAGVVMKHLNELLGGVLARQ